MNLNSKTTIKDYLPLLFLLGSITVVGPLAIDLYLPAFPAISHDLGAPIAKVELTLAAFFIGLASGQIIYGPLSDRFGRRKPLIVGMLIYVIASFLCSTAKSVEALILYRFLQSLGSCAGLVISRAIVRDLFKPIESAKVFSTLMLITAAAPILAPTLGGLIVSFLNWKWIFLSLGIFSSLSFILLVTFLPETAVINPEYNFKKVIPTYWEILKDRSFTAYALSGSFAQASLFAFLTGSPFVFIEYFKIPSDTYGLIFGINALFIVTVAQINARALNKIEMSKVFRLTFFFVLIIGTLLALCGYLATHYLMISIPVMLFMGSMGILFPLTTAQALAKQGPRAGSASALIGTIQYTFAALASFSVSLFNAKTPFVMTGLMATYSFLSFVCYYFLVMKYEKRLPK